MQIASVERAAAAASSARRYRVAPRVALHWVRVGVPDIVPVMLPVMEPVMGPVWAVVIMVVDSLIHIRA
jgi:hypothetical protein